MTRPWWTAIAIELIEVTSAVSAMTSSSQRGRPPWRLTCEDSTSGDSTVDGLAAAGNPVAGAASISPGPSQAPAGRAARGHAARWRALRAAPGDLGGPAVDLVDRGARQLVETAVALRQVGVELLAHPRRPVSLDVGGDPGDRLVPALRPEIVADVVRHRDEVLSGLVRMCRLGRHVRPASRTRRPGERAPPGCPRTHGSAAATVRAGSPA